MAKEEKVEEEAKKKDGKDEAAGGDPTRKGSKRGLIKYGIIGVGVLIILSGGFFGWRVFSKKGAEDGAHVSTASTTEGDSHKESTGHIVPLDSFVINLADPSEVRYLKVTINLEVDKGATIDEAQTKMPQIRDALLMLLTSKTSNDMKDTGGKLKLQDEMVARVNNFIRTGKVKAVYLTEFVMQ